MNKEVQRLLRRHARETGIPERMVMRQFNSLPGPQRSKLIKEIKTAVFSERLRTWRGERKQSEAADILKVPLSTYCNWEQGVNTPTHLARKYLETVMSQNPEN